MVHYTHLFKSVCWLYKDGSLIILKASFEMFPLIYDRTYFIADFILKYVYSLLTMTLALYMLKTNELLFQI